MEDRAKVAVLPPLIPLTAIGTGFDVRKPTTTLVRSGVFRLSRNRVYFSMLVLCLGIALLANSVALLALSFPAVSEIRQRVSGL